MASPAGYWDRFQNPNFPSHDQYQKVLANPGVGIQCAEFNEQQSITNNRIKLLADQVLNDGTFIKGGDISTTNSGTVVSELATLGGTITVGDVLKLTFTSSSITGSPLTIQYTTLVNDTLASAAAGLVALINANANLKAANVKASSSGAVITITYPAASSISFSQAVTGSATETITLSLPPIYVLVTAGVMYANGYFHAVNAAVVTPGTNQLQAATITGVGKEVLGIQIADHVATYNQDSTLGDPVSTSRNAGRPGADREYFTYQYVVNSPTAVTVATFNNGQLISVNNGSSLWQRFLDLLATYTFETDGSYIVERPTLALADVGAGQSSNPAQIQLKMTDGIGYPNGRRQDHRSKVDALSIIRPITTVARNNEPQTFVTSGNNIYNTFISPYLTTTGILATVQSPSFSMTRGSIANGTDAIPVQYQPPVSLVSVVQGGTTYVAGVDYQLSGNNIQWLVGGNAPLAGSTYTVVDTYAYNMVKAVRTLTTVAGETHVLNKSETATIGGNFTETVTVGGTLNAGDILKVTFTGSTIVGSPVTAQYTTVGGDTTTTMATGLKNAINALTALTNAGITATSSGPVVTITYPAAASVAATPLTFSKAVTGAATETLTLAQGFIGDQFKVTFTSTGISGSPVTATYTAIANDTQTTIATGLKAAINATGALTAAGISATSSGNVVTISYPINISGGLTFSQSVVPSGAGGETITLATSSTYATLTHAELSLINSITNGGTTYVLGTDYTVNLQTGVVTWLTTAPSVALTFNYIYWAHTIDGDFIARDSFQDAAGNVIYYGYPSYAGTSGGAIDYAKSIYIRPTGTQPVNNSTFYVSYNYVIGRIDVLVWNDDGTFQILPGVPALNPVAPVALDTQLPIAKIILPPEAFATNVSFEYYNNQRLLVTEQRQMKHQIDVINYNLSQFQLAQAAVNSTAQGVQKRGIFADPFVSPLFADNSHPSFAITWDFLSQTIQLPRTFNDITSLLTFTGSGATLKNDIWMTNYTEVPSIQQPYTSQTDQINTYGFVNLSAKITLNPSSVTAINNNVINVIAQGQGNVSTVANSSSYSYWVGTAYLYPPGGNGFAPTTIPINGSLPTNTQYGAGQIYTSSDTHLVTAVNTSYSTQYNPGVPLTPAQMMHSQLWQNLAPSTPVAGSVGLSTSSIPSSVLDQIPVDPDWTQLLATTNSTSGTGVIQQNQWASVISSAEITTAQYAQQSTITITGSRFIPSKGAIVCLFNGSPVALTPTGGTTADGSNPGAVNADSNGNFTATFTVPANTLTGTQKVAVVQSLPNNPGITASMAQATLSLGAYNRNISIYETFAQPELQANNPVQAAYYLCNTLGFMPNQAVLNSISAPISITIAEAVIQAKQAGITLNNTLLIAAMSTMFKTTAINPQPSASLLNSVAAAVNYNSLDPNAISAAILAVAPGFSVSLQSQQSVVVDPIAQTFTMPSSGFVTSVDVFFNSKPATEQVGLMLATVSDGVPTTQYLAQTWLSPASINTGGALTKFTFDKPVYLKEGTEYAFVVKTNDVTATLYTARVGGTDTTGLGLITKNPSTGVMLQSANASTWTAIQGASIKHNVNIASFSANQSILNLGLITFPVASSRMALYAPTSVIDNTTSIQWQYSFDNSVWTNFAPCKEVDLGGAFTTVYLRLVLNGTAFASPVVQNAPTGQAFVWLASGSYLNREIDLQSSSSRYTDLYIDAQIPGNTSITPKVSFDHGVTWNTMTLQAGDTTAINTQWNQLHYTYDTGGTLQRFVRVKLDMSSSVNYITPRLANFRLINS